MYVILGSTLVQLENSTLSGLFVGAVDVLNIVVRVIVAIAVIVFVWGIVKFLYTGRDNPKVRTEAAYYMLFGVLALATIGIIWGLVRVGTSLFNVEATIPQFNSGTSSSNVRTR